MNVSERYTEYRNLGMPASQAMHAARTTIAFDALELQGKARVRAEYDPEPYEWGDIEPTQEDRDRVERLGVFGTIAEVFDGCEHCGHGDWEHVDSCGGHAGYEDVCDPKENWIVLDHMAACVTYWENK